MGHGAQALGWALGALEHSASSRGPALLPAEEVKEDAGEQADAQE